MRYFPHEQLDVYGVALRFATLADGLLATWASSWAVHGQFDRAVESVVTNLAKAARLRSTDAGVYSIECSLVDTQRVKGYLREVMAMLSGLRGYLDE